MKSFLTASLVCLGLFCGITITNAQEGPASDKPVVSFGEMSVFEVNQLVSVPVYIQTNGHELDAIQVKIDISGGAEQVAVRVNSQLPVQEIEQVITADSIFVTISSLTLGQRWSAESQTELFTIDLSYPETGQLMLGFDAVETVAASNLSDENVLVTGNTATLQFGDTATTTMQPEYETTTATTQQTDEMMAAENVANMLSEKALIAIIIVSVVGAGLVLFFMGKKNKSQKPLSETTNDL